MRFGIGGGGRALRGGVSVGRGGARGGVGVGPFSVSGGSGGGSGIGGLVLVVVALFFAVAILVYFGSRLIPVVLATGFSIGLTIFLLEREPGRVWARLLYLAVNAVALLFIIQILRVSRSGLETAALNVPRSSENEIVFKEMFYSGLADGCSIAIWAQVLPGVMLLVGGDGASACRGTG